MRIIARSTLFAYAETHAECKPSLAHWETIMRRAQCKTMHDVLRIFPKAKILNGERVRFEIAGGNHRMICAIDFDRSVVFVKFLGTHADYDRIDALTIAIY
jgi:mRNA interferase HigB